MLEKNVQNVSCEIDDYLPKRMNTILKMDVSCEKKLDRLMTDE